MKMFIARKFGWALLALLLACPAFARHRRTTRFLGWWEYRVFVPSRANLLSQNIMIDALGLPRIKNDSALKEMVRSDDLVPITQNRYVRVSPKLEAKRRFCRPWVDVFLQELGQEYHARFGVAIQVNSAVRTEKTQKRLRRVNRNAAPVHGEAASAHLAGVAVDLQRRGLTREQIKFVQQKLLYLSKLGMIIAEEELQQPCFHIVVTGEYPYPPPLTMLPLNIDRGIVNGIVNPTTAQD